ncbi:hypothetical protein LQD23_08300 [Chromobacterium violaceum]|uniref:hypothetical protein n=1 Tax=Chromobacterium violaceum TaxID=536 RepID=UPI001E490D06|nr:hypothetical protein [Chromobacterium violaceum]MCD0492296.1 hypothetical protein [Chromobacterium violaceum]
MNIDLQQFCASEHDRRTWLRTPFNVGGKTGASNGLIMIELDAVGDHPSPPSDFNMAKVLDSTPTAGYEPLPALPAPVLVPCRKCGGHGHGRKCESCDGDGEFEHHDHHYECKACDGEGELAGECPDCRGTGKRETSNLVQINDAFFNLRYLSLVAALPGSEIATAGPSGIAGFRFIGGRGALMPTRT